MQMLVLGVIASAVGIALALAIDWFPPRGLDAGGRHRPPLRRPAGRLGAGLRPGRGRRPVLRVEVPHASRRGAQGRPADPRQHPPRGRVDRDPGDAARRPVHLRLRGPAPHREAAGPTRWSSTSPASSSPGASSTRPQGAGGKPVSSNELYLPKDRPVQFQVRSKDVIHDFWVPDFRMKIDAVPGITTKYRVTPNRLGTYAVVCAELCGLGHAAMRQTVHVVTPPAFKTWMAKQTRAAGARAGGRRRGGQQPGRRRHLGPRPPDLHPVGPAGLRLLPHARGRGHDRDHRPESRPGPQGQERGLHPPVDPPAQRADRQGLRAEHHAAELRQ